jgi:hypothetical protein
MKVVYVGGTCPFCEGFINNPEYLHISDESPLTQGRHYTVVQQFEVTMPWASGVGYRLAEYELPDGWGHCSCGFREIDGDKEAFHKMMRENRPKTRELEPA